MQKKIGHQGVGAIQYLKHEPLNPETKLKEPSGVALHYSLNLSWLISELKHNFESKDNYPTPLGRFYFTIDKLLPLVQNT